MRIGVAEMQETSTQIEKCQTKHLLTHTVLAWKFGQWHTNEIFNSCRPGDRTHFLKQDSG